jgi:hypothetical protein
MFQFYDSIVIRTQCFSYKGNKLAWTRTHTCSRKLELYLDLMHTYKKPTFISNLAKAKILCPHPPTPILVTAQFGFSPVSYQQQQVVWVFPHPSYETTEFMIPFAPWSHCYHNATVVTIQMLFLQRKYWETGWFGLNPIQVFKCLIPYQRCPLP